MPRKKMTANTGFTLVKEQYSLESFITENIENDIEKVRWFTTAQNQKKVLLIKSDIGNGGTHLLNGLGKELLARKIEFVLLNGEEVLAVYQNRTNFEEYLATCEYCFIGIFSFARTKPDVWKWLQSLLVDFMKKGGKIGFTSRMDVTAKSVSRLFGTEKILEVILPYPSQDVLKRVVKDWIPDDIIESCSDEAFLKSSTVSDYCGFLICKMAAKIAREP